MKKVLKHAFCFLMILSGYTSFAQDAILDSSIKKCKFNFGFKCIDYSTNSLVRSNVKIYTKDSLIKEISFDSSETNVFELSMGIIYYCYFISDGYAPKSIVLNLKDNIPVSLLRKTAFFNYRGAKIRLIKIVDLPDNLRSQFEFKGAVGVISFDPKKMNFNYDKEYSDQIKMEIESIYKKVEILKQNPDLRKDFKDLNDTIKSKEIMLSKKREELLKERLILLEKQNENDKLEKEKILKEALLNEEKANSSSKQKQLDLANQLRINQEQKAKELLLIQQIEREQFLTQKKLNEAEINEQKIIAQAKQKELELANQERKTKELEIKNATYTKNAFLGLAVFIAIVSLLLLRAYFIKRNSNTKLHKQNNLIAEQKQEITDSSNTPNAYNSLFSQPKKTLSKPSHKASSSLNQKIL